MATTQTRPPAPKRPADAEPSEPAPTPGLQGAWWKWAVGLLMCYVIYGAFAVGGTVNFAGSGNSGRIVFFHVPVAILSYVCYAVAACYAIGTLRRRDLRADAKSAIAMELGVLFCVLATITGSLFAGVMWNSFWNWDPREISIVIMLLLYASYLVLRGAVSEQPETRARLSAVYVLVALIPATFLIWVVPRLPWLQSLHPPDTLVRPQNTSASYKAVLYPSFLAFTLLFVWLFQLRYRVWQLVQRRN
ncbi:MAG TPA: cytochrome c biogenesis protein CcsA [Chthonomonadaceae bacterium]|nr:cytochrome c biogenesis protein CcsA [Chthonomonadaceae bacterium]